MQALQTAGVNALGKIADRLAQMAADNLWSSAFGGATGGAGSFFSSIFGTGSSGAGAAAQASSASTLANNTGGAFFGPGFASGTDNAPGGLALIGENGPEIMNVPKGAQIIPNDVLRSGMGGGGVNVQGGSIYIQGDASDKTVALIQAAIAQQNAELPGKVVQAVTLAKKRRQLV
jgi:hypothetical protein